jgi:hypothetical protein
MRSDLPNAGAAAVDDAPVLVVRPSD